MKAVFHYRVGPRLQERLRSLPDVNVVPVDEDDVETFAGEIADADVLLHVLAPVTDAVLAMAPRLRLIQKIGVGVDTIDRAAAARRGVRVANMPGANSQAVAEQALMLMLAVLRKVVVLDAETRRGGGWTLDADIVEGFGEISGRTVGLVGYGAVPRLMAPALHALGARVLYHDREDGPGDIAARVPLEALLAQSDILSLHVPLTDETRHLIGAANLARMKPGAIVINTARGELVDEEALLAAMDSGRIAGAGLDVFAREPVDPANPLLAHAAVTATPHLSWRTTETIERSLVVALDNIRRLETGEPIRHEVAWP